MLRVALFPARKKKARDYGLTLLDPRKETQAPPDVILVPVATLDDADAFPGLRRQFPEALLVAALDTKGRRPAELSPLGSHPAVDDFLMLATLETELSFHLARWERLIAGRRELARLKGQVQELSASSESLMKQIEADLGMATEVQRALFPRQTPLVPGIHVSAKYLPAAGIGGDYYDIFELEDRKQFGVLMADSKTHGMAAALLSVLLKTSIEQMKDRYSKTFEFIEYLNRELNGLASSGHLESVAELSVLYAVLDRASLSLRFTSAGTLYPMIWRKGQLLETTRLKNPALGNLDHYAFRETEVSLEPGDRIFFFTDGLVPALAEPGKTLTATLEGIFRAAYGPESPSDALAFQNELLARIHRYKEKRPLQDDLTFVLLSVDEKALFLRPSIQKVPGTF